VSVVQASYYHFIYSNSIDRRGTCYCLKGYFHKVMIRCSRTPPTYCYSTPKSKKSPRRQTDAKPACGEELSAQPSTAEVITSSQSQEASKPSPRTSESPVRGRRATRKSNSSNDELLSTSPKNNRMPTTDEAGEKHSQGKSEVVEEDMATSGSAPSPKGTQTVVLQTRSSDMPSKSATGNQEANPLMDPRTQMSPPPYKPKSVSTKVEEWLKVHHSEERLAELSDDVPASIPVERIKNEEALSTPKVQNESPTKITMLSQEETGVAEQSVVSDSLVAGEVVCSTAVPEDSLQQNLSPSGAAQSDGTNSNQTYSIPGTPKRKAKLQAQKESSDPTMESPVMRPSPVSSVKPPRSPSPVKQRTPSPTIKHRSPSPGVPRSPSPSKRRQSPRRSSSPRKPSPPITPQNWATSLRSYGGAPPSPTRKRQPKTAQTDTSLLDTEPFNQENWAGSLRTWEGKDVGAQSHRHSSSVQDGSTSPRHSDVVDSPDYPVVQSLAACAQAALPNKRVESQHDHRETLEEDNRLDSRRSSDRQLLDNVQELRATLLNAQLSPFECKLWFHLHILRQAVSQDAFL